MFPEATTSDEAGRYLLGRPGERLLYYLLGTTRKSTKFVEWMPTVLTLPGAKERIVDAVAWLQDLDRFGVPMAALVEIESAAASNMFSRMLTAGGILLLTCKPTNLPGDTFELIFVVLNLTGKVQCGRRMDFGSSELVLRPIEWHCELMDAAVALEQIKAKSAPEELLALIPLMQKGGDDGIMKAWREMVKDITDPILRSDLTLVVVFADLVGLGETYGKLVEGLLVQDTPVVARWKAESRRAGKDEGKLEGKIESVIDVLKDKYTTIPQELETKLREGTTLDQIRRWLTVAVNTPTLDAFRKDAGFAEPSGS